MSNKVTKKKDKKKKKKKSERDGKSRFTKTIAFRVPNELHKDACKKVGGKKNLGKHCKMLLKNDVEANAVVS